MCKWVYNWPRTAVTLSSPSWICQWWVVFLEKKIKLYNLSLSQQMHSMKVSQVTCQNSIAHQAFKSFVSHHHQGNNEAHWCVLNFSPLLIGKIFIENDINFNHTLVFWGTFTLRSFKYALRNMCKRAQGITQFAKDAMNGSMLHSHPRLGTALQHYFCAM